MVHPPTVAGPAPAGCRFRFRFIIGEPGPARRQRRLAVAEYLDNWVPLRVVAEHVDGRRCWVWFETRRAVAVDVAKDFVRDCPGYAPRSFKLLG